MAGRNRRAALAAGVMGAALAWAAVADAATPEEQEARITRLENAVAALTQQVQAQSGLAQENAELHQEVTDLTAQVQDLKSSTSAQIQDVRSQASAVTTTISGGKPLIASADGSFTFAPRGVFQFDVAQYFQPTEGPIGSDFRRSGPAFGSGADFAHARQLKNGDLVRRGRIGFDGTVFKDVDYRLLFDFGGSGVENTGQLYEAWVQYSGFRPVRVKVGAFAPSDGLEDQGSTNGMPLLERPGASDVARAIAGGDTRTAVQVYANGDRWFVSGAVTGRTIGVVNTGTATGTAQTFSDQLGLIGRVAFQPLHGYDWLVHVGAHGSYVVHPANATGPATLPLGTTPINSYVIRLRDTPELRVDGTQFVDTGSISANHASELGLEFAAQKKNLFLQAEYERFHIERSDGIANPTFTAWYVEGSWILTGETRKYNAGSAAFDAPGVDHPFKPGGGGWGAWEIALRYSDTDLNYHQGALGTAPVAEAVRGGEQKIFSAGLNWYLNPLVRFMFDYQHVDIIRLSPSASAYSTLVGADIGQTYNALSFRSQVAF